MAKRKRTYPGDTEEYDVIDIDNYRSYLENCVGWLNRGLIDVVTPDRVFDALWWAFADLTNNKEPPFDYNDIEILDLGIHILNKLYDIQKGNK